MHSYDSIALQSLKEYMTGVFIEWTPRVHCLADVSYTPIVLNTTELTSVMTLSNSHVLFLVTLVSHTVRIIKDVFQPKQILHPNRVRV